MDYKLTPRELEVLWTVAEMGSNLAGAVQLELSEQTVKNHITAVLRKTGSTSALQAYHRLYGGQRLVSKTIVVTEYEEES